MRRVFLNANPRKPFLTQFNAATKGSEHSKKRIYSTVINYKQLHLYNQSAFVKRAAQANRRAKSHGAKGKITARTIANIYTKQFGRCACCKILLQGNFEIDHIFPLSKGGSNYIDNLQLLRPTCNKKKGAKLPDKFKCLKHRIYPSERYCRLCDAKEKSNGQAEYAKILFIRGCYYA